MITGLVMEEPYKQNHHRDYQGYFISKDDTILRG